MNVGTDHKTSCIYNLSPPTNLPAIDRQQRTQRLGVYIG